jgi:uncharacterized protein (DUF849 family)
MLQSCLNGGLSKSAHHGVPTSASELASDAVAVLAAGAEELHIHVRAEDGAETLEPSAVAKTIQAVRRAAPGMPIGGRDRCLDHAGRPAATSSHS